MPKYLDGAGLSHFWESIKPKLGGVTKSGSGTVVSSDDAANLPPLSLTIHGESVQDGTTSPSSPVPIRSVESANLAPFFSHDITDIYNATTNPNGYWYSYSSAYYKDMTQLSDGWVHIEVTGPDSSAYFRPKASEYVKAGKTYLIVAEIRNLSSTIGTHNNQLVLNNGNLQFGPSNMTISLASETVAYRKVERIAAIYDANAENLLQGYVRAYDDGSSVSMDLRLSLFEKSAYTGYQTYGAITPAVCGKNMFDALTASPKRYIRKSNGTIQASDNWSASDFIKVKGGEQYVMSGIAPASSDVAGAAWYDDFGTYISGEASNVNPITAPSNASFVRFSVRTENPSAVQFEQGATATEYEPYQSTTIPIDLQGHALHSLPDGTEDTLEVDGEGNVTLTKNTMTKVFDGSESWTAYNGGGSIGYYFYTNLPNAAASQTKPTLLCSHCVGSTAVSPTKDMVTIGTTKNVLFPFGTTLGISTVADWKTWLASNPITLIYELAEPQTISLGKIDLPSLPSPSFSMHVDALVTPTIDAEWWTQGGGRVIDAVSTRISALESEVDALQEDVTELQGQVPEKEILYDTSTWTIVKYGRTVVVHVHGATATPSTSTALVTGILADYKPAYNYSATISTSSGTSTQTARLCVYASDGGIYIVPAGYTSSASWYGTLTYIY